jgi:hypothetical protein
MSIKDNFDCDICVRTLKINIRNKKIECDKCNYITCNGCQKKYEKPYCMNCNNEFSKTQVEELLGKIFVKKFIIDKKIKELLEKEKILIQYSDELLKYKKAIELDKKLLRKGQKITEINLIRPTVTEDLIDIINSRNCTDSKCKGTIKFDKENINLICFLCKKNHCKQCFEIKDNEHKCDPSILESIISMYNTTKACPKCNTLIYKIDGCDSMHCTYCNTYFHWVTKVIMKTSSNHHYRHNINNFIQRNNLQNDNNVDCILPNIEPQIPLDVFKNKLLQNHKLENTYIEQIIKYLYDDCEKIRKYFFEEIETMRIKYIQYNDDLRIKYIENEISETNWGKLLYNRYKDFVQKQKEIEIISYYINCIDYLQSKVYNDEIECFSKIIEIIIELYKCCNECFGKINNEFYCSNKSEKDFFKFTLPTEEIPILMYKKISENNDLVKSTRTVNKFINLLPYQYEHYNKIVDILNENKFIIDLSELGSGKTYTTCKYLQETIYDYIFIVCPPSLRKKWTDVTNEYGIKCNIINYTEIAGIRHKQPKHGLLYRDDFTVEKKSIHGGSITCKISNFKETKLLNDIKTENKIILVFDEIQYLKQEYSNITQASRILIKSILENEQNKAIFISGTPFDKIEQFITFFKNVGIQKSNELFEYDLASRRNQPIGYNEIIEYFSLICDREQVYLVDSCYRYGSLSKKICLPYIKRLFLEILIPKFSSKMFITKYLDNDKVNIKNINTFYSFDREDEEIIEKGLLKCIDIINNVTDKEILSKKRILIFKSLQIIESAKIKTMIKEAKSILDNGKNINSKVVLCVNYRESINELKTELIRYNPIILNGDISPENRTKLINKFQNNDNEYRLIIGNINIFCCGIDLDDKHGDYPRYVFVSPNFSTINLFQLSYRFLRSLDTKSSTIIRYIYSLKSIEKIIKLNKYQKTKNDRYFKLLDEDKTKIFECSNSEISIFSKLSEKSDLLKSVVNHGDSKYICNYDCEIFLNN